MFHSIEVLSKYLTQKAERVLGVKIRCRTPQDWGRTLFGVRRLGTQRLQLQPIVVRPTPHAVGRTDGADRLK